MTLDEYKNREWVCSFRRYSICDLFIDDKIGGYFIGGLDYLDDGVLGWYLPIDGNRVEKSFSDYYDAKHWVEAQAYNEVTDKEEHAPELD